MTGRGTARPDPNMNRHKPHMVQFSGHGTPDGLLMMGPRDRSVPLAADRLINMLRWAGEDLRIVFFNICDSEQHARAAARIVDAAIGMRGRMHDEPARMFAAHLYSALASGISLKRVFHQACAAIGDEPDSAIPQLFFRNGSDPHKVVLVRPDSPWGERKPSWGAPNQPSPPSPPNPPNRTKPVQPSLSGKLPDVLASGKSKPRSSTGVRRTGNYSSTACTRKISSCTREPRGSFSNR